MRLKAATAAAEAVAAAGGVGAANDSSVVEALVLETRDGESLVLGRSTFVVALDETGHEDFADPDHPVFGIGGCAFLVSDYQRLVAKPWEYMCSEYFADVERPLHACELREPTEQQLDALRHFFEKFQFFRVAVTATAATINEPEEDLVQVVGAAVLERIIDVAKWASFDRLLILFEDCDRLGTRVLASLAGKSVQRSRGAVQIELGTLPKSGCEPALEVADFIIHTAGGQTRARPTQKEVRKDFEIIFRNVDERLVSFVEITRIAESQSAETT